MNWLDDYYSKDERAKIKELEEVISNKTILLDNSIVTFNENQLIINNLKQTIKSITETKIIEEELETYWNNKWKKSPVTYKAQGFKRDIRNMILTKSYILQTTANKFKTLDNDTKALNCLRFIKQNITYTSDIKTHKMPEFWQNPEETWQTKTGDCEDGALLIISLLRMAGVPAFRIKLCAGNVLQGTTTIGHAYAIYLSEKDNQWYALDWCFYPIESINSFNKKPHKDIKYYLGIWWTVNDTFSWAQHSTEIE